MNMDLTPSMTTALATIGKRKTTATALGVGGCTMKRLWQLGFLVMESDRLPPIYRLSDKGEGAAAILNSAARPVDREGPIARIQRIVVGHYHIPLAEMVSARRSRNVARPRQVAMYLARHLTPYSLPHIGRHFGHRDHTTVIHAIRQVERLISEVVAFAGDISSLYSQIDERVVEIAQTNLASQEALAA